MLHFGRQKNYIHPLNKSPKQFGVKSFIHSKINIDYMTNIVLSGIKHGSYFQRFYNLCRRQLDTRSYEFDHISNTFYDFSKTVRLEGNKICRKKLGTF
jgi:REP element-mobilizing transposase RayT